MTESSNYDGLIPRLFWISSIKQAGVWTAAAMPQVMDCGFSSRRDARERA